MAATLLRQRHHPGLPGSAGAFCGAGPGGRRDRIRTGGHALVPEIAAIRNRSRDGLSPLDRVHHEHPRVQLCDLNRLSPESSSILTMRGNTYVRLDMSDMAMVDYRKASEITNSKQAWIESNIGNLLGNQSFYTDALGYFHKALELSSDYQYALGRMATTVKLREEQQEAASKAAIAGKAGIAQRRLAR